MSEFPQMQDIDTSTPQGLAMDRLQKAIYVHELERLGLPKGIFDVCEFCERKKAKSPPTSDRDLNSPRVQ